jgi:hypothetical protein
MDNRKDKRFTEHNNVLIRDKGHTSMTADAGGVNGHTHDISVTGAWICCKLDFPVGRVVRIAIDLEETRQVLEVDGEVIWARRNDDGRHFDFGVEFLHEIPDTILSLIRHLYGKKVGVPSMIS